MARSIVIHFRSGTGAIEKIERFEKTVTRRPFTDTNVFYFKKLVGKIVKMYEGGKYVPALIVDVRRERLGDLSDRDARAEGFRNLEEFRSVWRSIYGGFSPDQLVVAIEFVGYGCWRFEPGKRVVVEGVEIPLCRGVKRGRELDRRCLFCWLSPAQWCGTCKHLEVRGSKRVCRALGEALIDRLERVPSYGCQLYERRIPQPVQRALAKLRSAGVERIEDP